MMKNKMYAGALFCALAMMASCSNEEAANNVQPQTFSLKAEMGKAQTRTTVTEDYKVNWSAGDKIYVYGTNNVYSSLTLEGNGGSTTGTFKGTLKGDGDVEDLQYALYPVPTVSSTGMTINLPATYNYGYPSNSPMYAVFGDDKESLTFYHLCGMIRLKIASIPSEGTKTLTLTATEKNIAGDATVTETDGTFSLAAPETEGKSVSIIIPSGTPAADATGALVFDIPLPTGSYTSGLKLGITVDGNNLVAEKTINNVEIVAGEIMVMNQLKVIDLSITGNTSALVEATHVATEEELTTAITEGKEYITLTGDITISESLELSESGNSIINLNEHTLTYTNASNNICTVESGQTLSLENGSIMANNSKKTTNGGFTVRGTLTMEDIKMETTGSGPSPANNGTIKIKNSTIAAKAYAVSTNALNPDQDVTIELTGSTFTGPTPILLNIPGTMTLKDCTVTGTMQGAIIRGGTVTIENSNITLDTSKFKSEDNAKSYADYFDNKNWGAGNEVNLAAITIGNKSKGYQYPTSVTLNNTMANVTGQYTSLFPAIYVYANQGEGLGVTLDYDAQSSFTDGKGLVYGINTNITVNGAAIQ